MYIPFYAHTHIDGFTEMPNQCADITIWIIQSIYDLLLTKKHNQYVIFWALLMHDGFLYYMSSSHTTTVLFFLCITKIDDKTQTRIWMQEEKFSLYWIMNGTISKRVDVLHCCYSTLFSSIVMLTEHFLFPTKPTKRN